MVNGKIYIGQSRHADPSYLGSGNFIKKAIKKHGLENFSKEILEICESQSKSNEREKFWIKKLNSQDMEIGYNIASGGSSFVMNEEIARKISRTLKGKYTGENSFRHGIKLSPEHISAISKKNYGKIFSEETRNKMSEARKGISFSAETRKRISISHTGKKLSDFHRSKISESLTGRTISEQTKNLLSEKNINRTQKNSLIIQAKSLTEESKIIFNNCSQASRFFNCTRQRIKSNNVEGWEIEIINKPDA